MADKATNVGGLVSSKATEPGLDSEEIASEERSAAEAAANSDQPAPPSSPSIEPPGPQPSEASSPEPDPIPEGTRNPGLRYLDEGIVATGGMSSIHRVFDKALGRRVAMKRIDPNVGNHTEGVRRFVSEARVTGRLDHPNIVPVHDLDVHEDGNVYFTMKLIEGKTLDELIHGDDYEVGSPESYRKFLEILVKICDALSFAHDNGVIHRDIKPENVMVGSYGQVYLMDWGIARTPDEPPEARKTLFDLGGRGDAPQRTRMGLVFGTPQYLAPEQARGEIDRIDARTDVFALGAVLYEILTLGPPYPGEDTQSVLELARDAAIEPPAPPNPRVKLPPGLVRIAERALAEDPEDRYQSVEEFKDELSRFTRGAWKYETVVFQPGTVILQEGEMGDTAYIILEGTCEAYRIVKGRKLLLRRMGPGDTFGETAVFTSQARAASVRAVDRVVTKVVDAQTFEEWLGLDSWIGNFARVLAMRFRELSERNTQLLGRLSDAEMVVWTVSLLNFTGYPINDRECAGTWSTTLQFLCERFERDPEEIEELFEQRPEFRVDQAQDLIIMKRPK